MDRALLIVSTLCFLLGFGYTMFSIGAGHYRSSRFNFFSIVAGFLFQSGFLYLRGQTIGRCPLSNLFEVFIFLSWSMVLLYLLVGPAYRLSLLGAFTSPLVFVFQVFAMLAPIDIPAQSRMKPNPWLEMHASLSVIAYGAFALACVAGIMYLAQERQLKTHRLRPIFFHLPPIANLAVAINRLIAAGLALLTLGLLAGFAVGQPLDRVKVGWSFAVWLIYADESNLEQVVVNLVVNARDAMPESGQLTIRTEAIDILPTQLSCRPQARAGRFVCLSVSDTGCGMNAATLSHIFEPFFTTKEVGKGTGLGLATVYGIVANQGGWIEVKSEVGVGTAVSVFLPASTASAKSEPSTNAQEVRGGNETILVVEDEPAVRGILRRVLRGQGYEVLETADGHAAIDTWAERHDEIDLLMTDIVMPNGLKGNILAERLQAQKADLKVIFSSGYTSQFGTESSPLSEGCNFLEKPYKPDVLVRAVRDCLDS